MRLTLEESTYGSLPEGEVLNAEVTSVKKVEKPWVDKKTGEQAVRVVWEFTILDDEYAGRKIWQDLFPSFFANREKCRLYDWTLTLLNRDELPEGFVLDTEAFEGQRVAIMLHERKFTRRDGSEGSTQDVTMLTPDEAAGLTSAGTGARETVPSIAKLEDDEIEPF